MKRGDKPGRVIILAGPTASGKSALALDLAEALGGTVINADSMQVYRDLPILTAQPGRDELSRVPHRLYGFMTLDEVCDAQTWATLAAKEIDLALEGGRVPIVTGGTGLYIRALVSGFSPLPEIPADIRAEARRLVREEGPAAIHGRLAAQDPKGAARLRATDPQRIARAWEVLQATGRPISWWQALPPEPLTPHSFLSFVTAPDRAALYAAIDARFGRMMAEGALAEVAEAERRAEAGVGGPASGGRKALGYAELASVARGESDPETALAAAQQATRRYAKRQSTWFRHQLPQANFISPDMPAMKFSQSSTAQLRQKIRDFLLTP